MIGQSKFIQIILWLFLGVVVGSYICLPISDPDLWWHITVGRWIVAHGTVPDRDYWNMFSSSGVWRAYSWSNEIALALIERIWSMKGLAVAQLVLGIGLTWSLQFVCGRIARDHFVGALFGVYAAVACYNNFTLRPQVIVWILYAYALLVADDIAEKGISSKRLALLALIGCLWANTHLTAALGLVAIAFWSLQNSLSQVSIKRATLAVSAFFVGTFVTPYRGGEWITFFAKGGHPLKYQAISEFQPATILQFSTVFVLLLVFLVLVVSYTTRSLPTIARGALGAGMLLAGMTAVKFLPFAALTWVLLFSVWWRESGATHRSRIHDNFAEGILTAKQNIWNLAPNTGIAIAFFVMSVSVVNIFHLLRAPLHMGIVPKGAFDFIEEKSLPKPLLNEFGSGGYLMYRMSDADGNPSSKVAIDGRTNVNPDEIWRMHQASFSGRANWQDFITKVNPGTILWRQGSPFVSLLLLSPDWCRVFASGTKDEDYVVFVRAEYFRSRSGELTSIDCE